MPSRAPASYIVCAFVSALAACIPIAPPVVPPDGPAVSLELVAEGLTSPVGLMAPPDQSGRLFVIDQAGQIRILDAGGVLLPKPFLEVKGRMVTLSESYDERGLLGLAFHPAYKSNGRFFVFYTAPKEADTPADFNSVTHLSEFRVSAADPNAADPDSERILLKIPKPQSNHNGGQLVFGPDGMLYIGVGDGGAANDSGTGHNPTTGNAQDKSTLLGKILRIDVDHGTPYGIPSDNPLMNDAAARPEIFAFGLRNPWGLAFDDTGAGRLFVADVGQNLFEEIDIIRAGGNFGWRVREGRHCFDRSAPSSPPAVCPAVDAAGRPMIEPIVEYTHADGISAIGGVVYRGAAIPELAGRYVFGDFSTNFLSGNGALFVATEGADGTWTHTSLRVTGTPDGRLGRFLLAIGRDTAGEVYVLTSGNLGPTGTTGKVHRIR